MKTKDGWNDDGGGSASRARGILMNTEGDADGWGATNAIGRGGG